MNKKIFIVLIFILSSLFCSCSAGTPVESSAETMSVDLTASYEIMRAESATENEIEAMVTLFRYLRDNFGANIKLMNDIDYIYFEHPENVRRIYIGNCAYTNEDGLCYSKDALDGLKENEYTTKIFDDGSVAIVAANDTNIITAVESMISYLVKGSGENGVYATLKLPDNPVGFVEVVVTPPQQFALNEITFDENAKNDMPAMYIQLSDNKKQTSINKNDYITATIALDGAGVYSDVKETSGYIKGRGNYSWGLPKKPYNIKFEEKTDLCSLGAAKKWTLIANYSDKTLMRNYLTLSFAYDIGMKYTSECVSVNLYINDTYAGVYLLTERVQIHNERVDIDPDKCAVLFEIETPSRHNNNCEYCMETERGVHMLLVEPEVDENYSEEQIQQIRSDSQSIIREAEKAMSGGYDVYNEKIDVQSFIDWYIVSEFVKNYDSIFVTSCYGYINDSGKLAMGPVWDFDTCMGNQSIATCLSPEGWYIADATWYSILFDDNDFYNLVANRWRQLRSDGFFDRYIERIDNFPLEKAESIAENFKIWKNALYESGLRGDMSLFSYNEEVEYLRNWVLTRMEWIDEQFGYKGE